MKHTLLRHLAVSTLLLAGLVSRADYLILLEKGDSIVTKSIYTHRTTLSVNHGEIPLGDIVLMERRDMRWTYRSSDGKKIPLPLCKDRTAIFACAYAAKHGADKPLGTFPMLEPAWTTDPLFIASYRTALLDQWIRTDIHGNPLPNDTIRPLESEELSVILRTGDTLIVGKNNFFMKKDTLCWFGGGRLHKDQVLLLRSKKGLQLIQDWNGHIAKFDQPIPDLSPASRGVIYAHTYVTTTASDLPACDLADASVILAADATEDSFILARALNRSSTLSGVNTGLIIAKNMLRLMP